jgi:hypothetical protein
LQVPLHHVQLQLRHILLRCRAQLPLLRLASKGGSVGAHERVLCAPLPAPCTGSAHQG